MSRKCVCYEKVFILLVKRNNSMEIVSNLNIYRILQWDATPNLLDDELTHHFLQPLLPLTC